MELRDYIEMPDKEEQFEKIWDDLEKVQKKFEPFITISREEATNHCAATGSSDEFLGIPVSVKDCLCTKGIRTTAGSRILENYVPPFDAHVVERIKRIGYVIGKTAMDEFGFGTFSMN